MRSFRHIFTMFLFAVCVAYGANAAITRALPTASDNSDNVSHVVPRQSEKSRIPAPDTQQTTEQSDSERSAISGQNIRSSVSRVFSGRSSGVVSSRDTSTHAGTLRSSPGAQKSVSTARTTTSGTVVSRDVSASRVPETASGPAVVHRGSASRTLPSASGSGRSSGTTASRSSSTSRVAATGRGSTATRSAVSSVNTARTRSATVSRPGIVASGGSVASTSRASTRTSGASTRTSAGRTATTTGIAQLAQTFQENAELMQSCQTQYNDCMDQFCSILDDSLNRCSCSSNVKHYAQVESAVKNASSQLSDVAQQIRYVGLSADEIRAIMNETVAESTMKTTTDSSENANLLSEIEDLIRNPSKTSSYYVDSGTTELNLDLDFSSDKLNILSLDFLTGASNTSSISNLRGASLYNAAKKRCNDILTQCRATGANIATITATYDMSIDRDCTTYERTLNERNDTLLSNVRSANLMLQKARLAVLQNKNQYDAKGCVAALDKCMQDDMVCGSDYTKCLDPTQRYIDADGDIILGQRVTTITDFMTNYNNASINGDWLFNAYTNQKITDADCSALPATNIDMGGNDGSCIAKYLMQKIGTKSDPTAQGLCRAVLDRCQRYSYTDDVYQPYNDVVVNYIQNTMRMIHSAQRQVLSEYASECISDVSECYNMQIDRLNTYSNSAIVGNVARVLRGACRNIALTCAYAVFADKQGQKQCTDEETCIDSISAIFYQSLMCPLNSTYLLTEYTGTTGNGTDYVSSRCKCNTGYEVWGASCLPKCDDGIKRDSYGVCGGGNQNPNNPSGSTPGGDNSGCSCILNKSSTVTLDNSTNASTCCTTGGAYVSASSQSITITCNTKPSLAVSQRATCVNNSNCKITHYVDRNGNRFMENTDGSSSNTWCVNAQDTLYAVWDGTPLSDGTGGDNPGGEGGAGGGEDGGDTCTDGQAITLTLNNTQNAGTCCDVSKVDLPEQYLGGETICNSAPTWAVEHRATCGSNPNCVITGYKDDSGTVWMNGTDGSSSQKWTRGSATLYAVWSDTGGGEDGGDTCTDGQYITLTLDNIQNAGTCCDVSKVDKQTETLGGDNICNSVLTRDAEKRATCGSNPNCVITGYADDSGTLWMNGEDGSSSQKWTRGSATLYAVWSDTGGGEDAVGFAATVDTELETLCNSRKYNYMLEYSNNTCYLIDMAQYVNGSYGRLMSFRSMKDQTDSTKCEQAGGSVDYKYASGNGYAENYGVYNLSWHSPNPCYCMESEKYTGDWTSDNHCGCQPDYVWSDAAHACVASRGANGDSTVRSKKGLPHVGDICVSAYISDDEDSSCYGCEPYCPPYYTYSPRQYSLFVVRPNETPIDKRPIEDICPSLEWSKKNWASQNYNVSVHGLSSFVFDNEAYKQQRICSVAVKGTEDSLCYVILNSVASGRDWGVPDPVTGTPSKNLYVDTPVVINCDLYDKLQERNNGRFKVGTQNYAFVINNDKLNNLPLEQFAITEKTVNKTNLGRAFFVDATAGRKIADGEGITWQLQNQGTDSECYVELPQLPDLTKWVKLVEAANPEHCFLGIGSSPTMEMNNILYDQTGFACTTVPLGPDASDTHIRYMWWGTRGNDGLCYDSNGFLPVGCGYSDEQQHDFRPLWGTGIGRCPDDDPRPSFTAVPDAELEAACHNHPQFFKYENNTCYLINNADPANGAWGRLMSYRSMRSRSNAADICEAAGGTAKYPTNQGSNRGIIRIQETAPCYCVEDKYTTGDWTSDNRCGCRPGATWNSHGQCDFAPGAAGNASPYENSMVPHSDKMCQPGVFDDGSYPQCSACSPYCDADGSILPDIFRSSRYSSTTNYVGTNALSMCPSSDLASASWDKLGYDWTFTGAIRLASDHACYAAASDAETGWCFFVKNMVTSGSEWGMPDVSTNWPTQNLYNDTPIVAHCNTYAVAIKGPVKLTPNRDLTFVINDDTLVDLPGEPGIIRDGVIFVDVTEINPSGYLIKQNEGTADECYEYETVIPDLQSWVQQVEDKNSGRCFLGMGTTETIEDQSIIMYDSNGFACVDIPDPKKAPTTLYMWWGTRGANGVCSDASGIPGVRCGVSDYPEEIFSDYPKCSSD